MNILKNIICTIAIVTTSSYALSLEELKSMPKSIERDFYIWKYLKDPNTTSYSANEASKLIFHINSKLDKAYYRKTFSHLRKRVYKPKPETLAKYAKLISKMQKSGNFYEAWLKLDTKDKLMVFIHGGTQNRALLNKDIGSKLFLELSNYKEINRFLFRVGKERLTKLKNVALNTAPLSDTKINYNNLLKLGFDNLKRDKEQLASRFFYRAIYKAKSRFYADKAIFWYYMATRDLKYLNKLANSHDFNIYKLIALDFLNRPYPTPATAPLSNAEAKTIDITNPIDWAILKKKIFSKKYNLYTLASKYNSFDTMAYYYYILNKASRDTKQYFPLPYRDILSKYTIDRQALIYAIARQESQFIPASVSSSFAVGMMQFMPFLVKHIAKVRGENVSLEDMFKPVVSIRFANTHLNYLNKYLYHPLFVAYAYNAGIGYTRRLIRKNIFKSGKYEPYLSLEMVDNEQANHYGKKVLANYVIYKKLLGNPIKITTLLNQLDKPHLTDKFR